MGLGSQGGNTPTVWCNLKAKVKDTDTYDPHFAIQKRNPDQNATEKYVDLPKETAISGWLKGFGYKMKVIKNKDTHFVAITLHDNGVDYVVSTNASSSLGRNFVNNLLSEQVAGGQWVRVSTYMKNDYPNLWIGIADDVDTNGNGINEEGSGWKYNHKDHFVPLITQYEDEDGNTRDSYKKVVELLLKGWKARAAEIISEWKAKDLQSQTETIPDQEHEAKKEEASKITKEDMAPDEWNGNVEDGDPGPGVKDAPEDEDDLPF